MNKYNVFLKYLVALILSVSITVIVLIMISNVTIFNNKYVKNVASSNNYYSRVSNSIYDGMQDYMVSSGFPDEILNDIYSDEDIKNSINTYIDGYYKKDLRKVNTNVVKEKLSANVYTYLKNHNIENYDTEEVNNFINDMIKIYDNKISLYHNLDRYVTIFNKTKTELLVLGIIVIITAIISFILLRNRLDFNNWGSITLGSSFMLLFIRFMLYNRIDFNNILIISEDFSVVLRDLLNGVGKLMIISLCILFVLGIFISIFKTEKE